MNRDPMTAGGTQVAGAQDPQSEGNNENNLGASTAGYAAQSEPTTPNSDQNTTLSTIDPAGEVINYDNFVEASPDAAVSETMVSAAPIPNDADMGASTVEANNFTTGQTQSANPTETNATDTPYSANTDMKMDTSTNGVAQTPTSNPGGDPSAVVTATPTAGTAQSTEESSQPNPAVLSALQDMGMNSDTPATKSMVEPAQNQNSPQLSMAKGSKPNRKGMIVGLIILVVLLLITGGLAIWFFAFYNQSGKIALDAMKNFVNADSVVTTGVVNIAPPEDELDGIENVQVSFGSTGSLPGTASVTLSFDANLEEILGPNMTTGDATSTDLESGHVELSLGTVQMVDGVIYLQVGGIMSSLEEVGIRSGSPIYEEMSEYFEVIELIDNEWWQISVPDIIDSLELDSAIGEAYKDLYDCTLKLAREDHSAEINRILSEHPFLELEPITRDSYGGVTSDGWNAYYNLDYDANELAAFINELPNTEAADGFYACYNAAAEKAGAASALSAENFDEVDASDLPSLRDYNTVINVEISRLGHRLKGLSVNTLADETAVATQINFDYESVAVTAPENYRPITELVEEIIEVYNEGANGMLNDLATDDDYDYTGDLDMEQKTSDDEGSLFCMDGTPVSDLRQCSEGYDDDDDDDEEEDYWDAI